MALDTTWTIIASTDHRGDPAFAVVHDINHVRRGFETREQAERWALQRAREAYAEGDESATVDEYLAGQHRTIWRPYDEARRPSAGRTKRTRTR
jgi:hypothetical protein